MRIGERLLGTQKGLEFTASKETGGGGGGGRCSPTASGNHNLSTAKEQENHVSLEPPERNTAMILDKTQA